MTIFDVDERFLQEKGFYFISIDIIEYFKEQLKNGKYIDNGFCGTFMLSESYVRIDGIEFENGNKAYIYFLDSNDYSVKEEIVKWNGWENRKKVYVYRNKYLFDVKNFYDIVRSSKKIIGVGDILFDYCILMDMVALNRLIKEENYQYSNIVKYNLISLNKRNNELELEIDSLNKIIKDLKNKNAKINKENKELKGKIKKNEELGNILTPKTKKLFHNLVSVINELNEEIDN